MKKIKAFVLQHEPKTPEAEIKKAYARESRQFGISTDSDRQILKYLQLNNLTGK